MPGSKTGPDVFYRPREIDAGDTITLTDRGPGELPVRC
jgi:hypothetical protein